MMDMKYVITYFQIQIMENFQLHVLNYGKKTVVQVITVHTVSQSKTFAMNPNSPHVSKPQACADESLPHTHFVVPKRV